jgi:hypothetical protein
MSEMKKGKYKGGKCLRGHDGLRYKSGTCVQCASEKAKQRNIDKRDELKKYHAQWYAKNKEKVKENVRRYVERNKDKVRGNRQAYVYMVKMEVLSHYSGGSMSCKHCGINDVEVLCLDHINDDGKIHRKHGSQRGKNMYIYARHKGFIDGLQVLCYNCNMKKEIERKRRSASGYSHAHVFHGSEKVA